MTCLGIPVTVRPPNAWDCLMGMANKSARLEGLWLLPAMLCRKPARKQHTSACPFCAAMKRAVALLPARAFTAAPARIRVSMTRT